MRYLKSKDFFKDRDFPFLIAHHDRAKTPVHAHEFFEFFYVLKGKAFHTLDGRENIVREGDIILLSPGNTHSLRAFGVEKFEMYNCIFLPNLLESHTNMLKNMKGFMELLYLEPFVKGYKLLHLSGPADIKIRIILDELYKEYTSKLKHNSSVIKIMLADLLVTLVRYFEQQVSSVPSEKKVFTKKAHAIIKSIEYIDAHFREELTLDDISLGKTGITKEYFCSIFKKVTGKTFTEYISMQRIEYSAKLLQNTEKPVSEICYDSGFNDLSYFNRTFKAIKGLAPNEYRKK